jgi:Flp pilus assembly protein TadB
MERIGDAPVPDWALEAVISDWIGEVGTGGQLDYYSRKTEQRARMQRTTSALVRASLWLSFGTVLFLALFQDWLGSDTTSLLLAILAVVGILVSRLQQAVQYLHVLCNLHLPNISSSPGRRTTRR